MSSPIGPNTGQARAAAETAQQAKLHKAARDLEGVFVNEVFKAMRATVPEAGLIPSNAGQEMFTSMMDERLAETYAERSGKGIGDALYRQLSRGLPRGAPAKGHP